MFLSYEIFANFHDGHPKYSHQTFGQYTLPVRIHYKLLVPSHSYQLQDWATVQSTNAISLVYNYKFLYLKISAFNFRL